MARPVLAGLAAMLAAVLSVGCATHRRYSPRAVEARLAEDERLRPGAPFALRAGAVGEPSGHRIGILGGSTVRVDYAECTGDLVRILEEALARLGVASSPEAERSLEVRVRHLNFAVGGMAGISDRYDCFVDVAVATSEGHRRGFSGTAGSAFHARACNHALAKVARAILFDPAIRAFLEEP